VIVDTNNVRDSLQVTKKTFFLDILLHIFKYRSLSKLDPRITTRFQGKVQMDISLSFFGPVGNRPEVGKEWKNGKA
jgi:hypothetical protein